MDMECQKKASTFEKKTGILIHDEGVGGCQLLVESYDRLLKNPKRCISNEDSDSQTDGEKIIRYLRRFWSIHLFSSQAFQRPIGRHKATSRALTKSTAALSTVVWSRRQVYDLHVNSLARHDDAAQAKLSPKQSKELMLSLRVREPHWL